MTDGGSNRTDGNGAASGGADGARGASRAPGPGEILNLEEACALLRVSAKTLAKALRTEDIPARKIGREWKFSRDALIEWVGLGKSPHYARMEDEEGSGEAAAT